MNKPTLKNARKFFVISIFFVGIFVASGLLWIYFERGNLPITGFSIFDDEVNSNNTQNISSNETPSDPGKGKILPIENFSSENSQSENKKNSSGRSHRGGGGIQGGGNQIENNYSNGEIINNNESGFNEGDYNNTFYNSTTGSIQVNSTNETGTYLSRIFDAGSPANWTSILWEGNVNVTVRSCDAPYCENDLWNETYTNSPGIMSVNHNRYFQYRADFFLNGNESPDLYNVTINYYLVDTTPPEINLISPQDSLGIGKKQITFSFEVNDESEINKCELIINDDAVGIINSVAKNKTQEFILSKLKFGDYDWGVRCFDFSGNIGFSETRKIIVLHSYGYSGQTTDFSKVNIKKITNLVLDKPGSGKIKFLEDVDLSGGADIDSHVHIGNNFIEVDSENIPQLNKSAILTFYGLGFENPIILKNGKPCHDCVLLSYEGNELTFSVQSFSNYSASENSQLEIWDDTDNQRIQGGEIMFYANYTDVTNAQPILGATCQIDFGEGFTGMSYNASSGLYEKSNSFGTGIHYFEVSCSAAGYTSFDLSDYASVVGYGAAPNGAEVGFVKSERGSIAEPGSVESYSGNVTEVNIFGKSITQSWQGYYGDVSGTIELADRGDNVLYNWSSVSPSGEVYAARFYDINFATVGCADSDVISFEESLMGQDSSDVDSISNTFNKKNHPEFYTGHIFINSDSCNSANIYGSSGIQDSSFFEVLLSDGALHIVYVSLLEQDETGFDIVAHDFEMIVSENGHEEDTDVTLYYFYLEIQ